MKQIHTLAALVIVVASLFATLQACPLCADAIANSNSGNDDDDKDNFPAAMNQSIYMMLVVPYSALGIVGFCIYRGMKKNDDYRNGQAPDSDVPE